MPNDCAMPLDVGSASQSSRSAIAPFARRKRSTASSGAPHVVHSGLNVGRKLYARLSFS
jgi:hypothetical protein